MIVLLYRLIVYSTKINGLKCTGLCSLLWEFLSWRREEEAEARGRTVALGGAGGGNRGVFRSQLHHQERKDAESTPSPSGTSKMVLVIVSKRCMFTIYYCIFIYSLYGQAKVGAIKVVECVSVCSDLYDTGGAAERGEEGRRM